VTHPDQNILIVWPEDIPGLFRAVLRAPNGDRLEDFPELTTAQVEMVATTRRARITRAAEGPPE
jgi:hypothetical protein